MSKQIEITVPNDFSAVTLKQYVQLQKDLDANEGDTEAQDAYLVYNLTGITPAMVKELDSDIISNIRKDLTKLLQKTDYPLQRKITIDGVEYGFEPNLSTMPYGAYLDIGKFENIQLNDDWPTVLSILYRPVKKRKGALYEIEKYNGVEPWDEDKWWEVGMDFHFGCFFFFIRLYKALVKGTLNSLKNQTEISPRIKSILDESGEAIQQLYNLQEKIS
jgi:hypothetical protein